MDFTIFIMLAIVLIKNADSSRTRGIVEDDELAMSWLLVLKGRCWVLDRIMEYSLKQYSLK